MSASLIDAIKRAFAPSPAPAIKELGVERGSLETGFLASRWTSRGRSYDEVLCEDYLHDYDAIYLLTPEGLRYYLPGFMIAALSPTADWRLHNALSRVLSLRATGERAASKTWTTLTRPQVECISAVLAVLSSKEVDDELRAQLEQCAADWAAHAETRSR